MSIEESLLKIKSTLKPSVQLVAVSKTKPVEDIEQAYQAGQRIFGENKIQEMAMKYEQLPKDIQWHMIGHVQTNKIKYMAPFVALVHGVDREKVLQELNKQAQKSNRVIQCLLQMHIATEETKFGLDENELIGVLGHLDEYSNVQVKGLMGMASFTEDQQQIRAEFESLKEIFDRYKTKYGWDVLSMGMSGDYKIAMECGSTLVRIGSSIFGHR
jgi:pyridoxal phosphate enzyme (YggS family)